jgi:hypothetical protein
MTQDEIIEMAQECKLIGMRPHLDGIYIESLLAFANLIAAKATAKEREACAKVCDEFNFGQTPMMIQRAIIARGEQE